MIAFGEAAMFKVQSAAQQPPINQNNLNQNSTTNPNYMYEEQEGSIDLRSEYSFYGKTNNNNNNNEKPKTSQHHKLSVSTTDNNNNYPKYSKYNLDGNNTNDNRNEKFNKRNKDIESWKDIY